MQELVAFAIVGLAAAYAAWKLMPRALRARLAHALAGAARRSGRLSDRDAALLARRLSASGCGSCDSCGSCVPRPDAAAVVSELRRMPAGPDSGSTARGEPQAVAPRE